MFIKPFRVKTSTAIRGSDRRKLRSEIGRCFPALPAELLSEIVPNKEDMTVSRIVTHSEESVTVYSLSGEPIFFEIEKRVIPTVYTLWKYPEMLPRFSTWPPVFDKLRGGADLMLPGVILPPGGISSIERFEKDTLWCITLRGNRAPVAVGVTTVSRKDMFEDGMRGKGVKVMHVYTDCLWALGSKEQIPQVNEPEPDNLDDDDDDDSYNRFAEVDSPAEEQSPVEEKTPISEATDEINNLDLSEDQKEDATLSSEVPADSVLEEKKAYRVDQEQKPNSSAEGNEQEDDMARSPQEIMDSRLEYCFFCALLRIRPDRDLPLLTSTFFRNHMLPYCLEGETVDLKKSSFKKFQLSKLLNVMQDRGLIKVQEVSKGVDHVVDVFLDNDVVREFKSSITAMPPKPESNKPADTETQTGPTIEEMFAVSAALVPIFSGFGYSKGSVLSMKQLRQVMTDYVRKNELVAEQDKRVVMLDPVLTSALINKNEEMEQLSWDALFSRVANKMNSCYKVTLPGQDPIIKKGKIDPLEIKIEQRMGNKKVTLVRNLDAYGIDPQKFAHNIQLKAACSTAVSQLPGKHRAPGMQVMVQGNQVHLVAMAILEDYNVPRKFVTGLELLKSGKKK
ncbi:predicted protein, partial [Nematostella vectensis]